MDSPNQLPLFDGSLSSEAKLVVGHTYSNQAHAVLFHGDRLDLLREIKQSGDKARLVVTSPPYNVGKEYEEVRSLHEYVEDQRATIAAAYDILAEDGSICWQVGHSIEGGSAGKEAFPLDLVLYPIFKDFGLKLKNRIVWTFGHGLHDQFRFSGRHETILWFVKGDQYTFNLDAVRVPQKYPGKRAFRGARKGELSGNPDGKNPGDVWDMPNVKSNHIEKTEHPCQFPIGLVERLVLALTNEGDLVVDPYLGAGTSLVAAAMHNRRGAGSDIELRYLQIAVQRVMQAINGTVPYRDMNKPIYEPGSSSTLASIPEEWLARKNGTSS